MFNNQIGRTLAAIACTIVFSATCVLAAVGPTAHGDQTVQTAARFTA